MAARKTKPEGKKPDKLWHHAIMRAVNRPANDVLTEKAPKLEFLADQLVMKGMGGDVPAIKEIGDRLDGKPSQQLTLSGDKENPLEVIHALGPELRKKLDRFS